jgi:adenosylhomocysteinase
MRFDIKDKKLAKEGSLRIEWASNYMSVVNLIREKFKKEKPLKGIRIGCCLHVTTETANLAIALKSAGAQVSLCASNPLSTQDDVAASLVEHYGISVFAVKGEDNRRYYKHINSVLDTRPHITMDDGADLVSTIHKERRDLIKDILAGTEETTTGVIRLKSLHQKKKLLFPMFAVNDAKTKHLFDNRYGTGQSTIDGIIRATNILLSGTKFVICGYGWCGKGIAKRAEGMGAETIVCEVDPLKALEAVMDGHQVMPIEKAAKVGDVFVTSTGNISVIGKKDFVKMKDGAIVANAGHFDVEIDIEALKSLSLSKKRYREYITQYKLKSGRRINLLAEGRLINLASAEGHPASVMDMSFANQALTCEYIKKNAEKLEKKVYKIPERIDKKVARLKLKSSGVKIDKLTRKQKEYLSSWQVGT